MAPVAAAFHPMMLTFADEDRLRDLPIYIVHGVEDWMFPPQLARARPSRRWAPPAPR